MPEDCENNRRLSGASRRAVTHVCGGDALAVGIALAGQSAADAWTAYIGLGGSMPLERLRQYLHGDSTWPDIEHDVAAHALNEHLWDIGVGSAVAYADELNR